MHYEVLCNMGPCIMRLHLFVFGYIWSAVIKIKHLYLIKDTLYMYVSITCVNLRDFPPALHNNFIGLI